MIGENLKKIAKSVEPDNASNIIGFGAFDAPMSASEMDKKKR